MSGHLLLLPTLHLLNLANAKVQLHSPVSLYFEVTHPLLSEQGPVLSNLPDKRR